MMLTTNPIMISASISDKTNRVTLKSYPIFLQAYIMTVSDCVLSLHYDKSNQFNLHLFPLCSYENGLGYITNNNSFMEKLVKCSQTLWPRILWAAERRRDQRCFSTRRCISRRWRHQSHFPSPQQLHQPLRPTTLARCIGSKTERARLWKYWFAKFHQVNTLISYIFHKFEMEVWSM